MATRDTGRRGPRVLAPDERRLWERVAATADPLDRVAPSASPPVANEAPARAPNGGPFASRENMHGAAFRRSSPRSDGSTLSYARSSPEVAPVGRLEAGLDRRTADRLRKGAREPDARIDLHGMRAERAHRACMLFLSDCLMHGHRMVLVITGKGGGRSGDGVMASGRGILRESLPGWLRASPLGHSIVGIYQAHPRHGGAGAFYVYLKRRR